MGNECIDPCSLTSELVGWECLGSCPGCFIPQGKNHGAHSIEGLVGPRAGLKGMEKCKYVIFPGLEQRNLRLSRP